jgi:16S rRNA (uracil1498-N3)-methyltransferase
MSNRFYSSHPIVGPQATLDGPEAHHLLHVMRLAAGADVTLFDGSGFEFRAKVTHTRRSEVELDILDRAEVDRELPFDLTLGVALPKGDRQRWLVEKVVELGVTRIVPLRTERGVAQPTMAALERLRRTVIEASKQCGRNRLAEITEPSNWCDFVSPDDENSIRFVAHPEGQPLRDTIERWVRADSRIVVGIGPEGGFTSTEVSTAAGCGWHTVEIGPRILRVETAAVMTAAVIGLCTNRSA